MSNVDRKALNKRIDRRPAMDKVRLALASCPESLSMAICDCRSEYAGVAIQEFSGTLQPA